MVTSSNALLLLLLLVALLSCGWAVPVADDSEEPAAPPITLRLRNGTEYSTVTWDPSTVALLVIDPWSFHWCKTACMRVGALMPRINAAVAAGRKLGMTVIWSPTDAQENYDGWPQRERAIWVPPVEPVFTRNSSIPSGGQMTPFSTQCMCGPWLPSLINADEMRMDPSLFFGPDDYIAGGSTVNEIYSIFMKHKIKHIIYLGVHENICVQAKAEGMDNMWKLGFDFVLARDMTDAFTGYDPSKPYLNPDNGTNMVTRFIEHAGIAKTTELRELAEYAKTWTTAVDTVLFAPWGQPGRPQIVETDDTVTVRVSTPCNVTTECERVSWVMEEKRLLTIVVTTDGSAPVAPKAGAALSPGPVIVNLTKSMQPQEPSQAHLGVVVRAAAYAVDPTGKSAPLLVYSEHNSTVIFRTGPLRRFNNTNTNSATTTTALTTDSGLVVAAGEQQGVSITDVPIYWGRSSPFYRRVPSINTTYQGHPFAQYGTGNLTLRGSNTQNSPPAAFTRGLGFWAPMHAEYNLTALSHQGFSRFVGWVGMDEFCQRNGFKSAPWMCHDVVEFASSIVRVMIDGVLVAESPVLRIQEGEWAFDVPFASSARIMRLEVLRGPVAQGGRTVSGGYEVNQDAYDLVDLVEAGFVSDAWVGTPLPPEREIAAAVAAAGEHGEHEHEHGHEHEHAR